MRDRKIRNVDAVEKVSFILVNYALRDRVERAEQGRLQELANIRNRLLHYGQLPKRDHVAADAALFVRMTEFVIAKSLRLQPSNIFRTIERFEAFLENSEDRQYGGVF